MYPLAIVENGKKAEVVDIRGGLGLKKRLGRMGLTTGTVVRVINNTNPGPVIVAVGEARLGLGRGMAHKILVELL